MMKHQGTYACRDESTLHVRLHQRYGRSIPVDKLLRGRRPGLNLVALLSTFVWQRPLHSRLAQSGYDEATVRRLIATNWIRTIDHWLIALLAITMLIRRLAV